MLYTDPQRQLLLSVACRAIRAILAGQTPVAPEPPEHDRDHDPVLAQPAGCFVSLHESGTQRLRGCVGRLEARLPILLAVHDAAISALEDPRFADERVTLDELPQLEVELTILSPLRPAEHPLAFEPTEHGIYLTIGDRGGCFLPQVARQTGWTRQQLLERLCTEKMGLPPHAWKQPEAQLHIFDAVIVGPEPLEPR